MRTGALLRQLDNPPPLILLYGQEPFLIERAVERIREVLFGAGAVDDFNDHQFAGRGALADEILDAARTFPVFAQRRLVTVRSFQDLPVQELDALLEYLDDPAPTTCLLLIADKIDNRRKFYQQFKTAGLMLKCEPPTDRELPDYLRRLVQAQGKRIDREAVELFCSLVGSNLHEIHGEVDKLLLYSGTRVEIDAAAVTAIVSRSRTESIFDLGNAIGDADLPRALQLIRRCCAAAEPPLLLLNLITGHFRLLWKVRALQHEQLPPAQIARQVGRPAFVVERLLVQARRFSRTDFLAAYRLFVETDLAMKSGGADAEALLDRLVIELIGARQKNPKK